MNQGVHKEYGKAFKYPGILKQFERNHTVEKPYKCHQYGFF